MYGLKKSPFLFPLSENIINKCKQGYLTNWANFYPKKYYFYDNHKINPIVKQMFKVFLLHFSIASSAKYIVNYH